jgi:hypothetical protein
MEQEEFAIIANDNKIKQMEIKEKELIEKLKNTQFKSLNTYKSLENMRSNGTHYYQDAVQILSNNKKELDSRPRNNAITPTINDIYTIQDLHERAPDLKQWGHSIISLNKRPSFAHKNHSNKYIL